MLSFFRKLKKDPKSELRKLLDGYELPSFSTTVLNVLTTLREPEFSMNKVAEQLQIDPGLHVKVLKTVNAAAFGLVSRVGNLHHAVTLLGRSRLEAVVLSHAVKRVLPSVEIPFFNMNQFWFVSAKRASLARILAHRFHPATQVESFTSGLLLDMGLPVIVSIKPEEYSVIMERCQNENDEHLGSLERELLKFDHTMVGTFMAEEWNLPDYLIAAISGHHDPDATASIDPAIRVVSHINIGADDDLHEMLINVCNEEFGLEQDETTQMIDTAFENAEELSHMFR